MQHGMRRTAKGVSRKKRLIGEEEGWIENDKDKEEGETRKRMRTKCFTILIAAGFLFSINSPCSFTEI